MAKNLRDPDRLSEIYAIAERYLMQQQKDRMSFKDRLEADRLWLKFQFLPHYMGRTPKWRLRMRSLSGPRTLPDFACTGAFKNGTSDLSMYLFKHPSIIPPLSKEIFSENTRDWLAHYPTVKEKQQVEQETGSALTGYFAPWMHHIPLIANYHAANPDAKVILMLRNPVERAYSHYKWDLLIGGKQQTAIPYYRSFAECVDFTLDNFPATPVPSRCGAPFLQTGIYVKSVQRWLETFGKERVHIVRSEDFFDNPPKTVCEIHEFLGLEPVAPVVHKAVNQNPLKVAPADDLSKQRLREFYRPWNEALFELIDRDLGWD